MTLDEWRKALDETIINLDFDRWPWTEDQLVAEVIKCSINLPVSPSLDTDKTTFSLDTLADSLNTANNEDIAGEHFHKKYRDRFRHTEVQTDLIEKANKLTHLLNILNEIPNEADKRIACTPTQLDKLIKINYLINASLSRASLRITNHDSMKETLTPVFIFKFNNSGSSPDPAIWNAKTYGENDLKNKQLFQEKLSCWIYEKFSDYINTSVPFGVSPTKDISISGRKILHRKMSVILYLDNHVTSYSGSLPDAVRAWKEIPQVKEEFYRDLGNTADLSWKESAANLLIWTGLNKSTLYQPLALLPQQIVNEVCAIKNRH